MLTLVATEITTLSVALGVAAIRVRFMFYLAFTTFYLHHLPVPAPVVLLLYNSGNNVGNGTQSPADCPGCQSLLMVAFVMGSASTSVQVIRPGFLVVLTPLVAVAAAVVATVAVGFAGNLGASVVSSGAAVVVVIVVLLVVLVGAAVVLVVFVV